MLADELEHSTQAPVGSIEDIKLIISDMDGTLLSHGTGIHDATHAAIKQLEVEYSIPFVLSTGRCRESALRRLADVGSDWSLRPGIFLNGAVLYGVAGDVIHESCFSVNDLSLIVDEFRDDKDKIVVQFCSGDFVLSPASCDVATLLHKIYADPYPTCFEGYSALFEGIKNGGLQIHMISILTSPGLETQVIDRLSPILPEGCSVVTAVPCQVAVLPPNTDKGAGALAMASHLGILPVNIAAIGDGHNDISMFQVVGLPVAMGNASDEVKQHAKMVVNRNDHATLPGVAHFLHNTVFNRQSSLI